MPEINLSDWIGKSETQTDVLDETVCAMLHATVDSRGTAAPASGEHMPPLWHWCAFTPKVSMAGLKSDGHPQLGDFLPPVALERRMWAGGKLTFHAPLKVAVPMTKTSEILAVVEKEGATGKMVFVTVGHTIMQDGAVAISESQDIVYLDIPDAYRPPKPKPVPVDADFTVQVPTSEALLFRYSAVTFNAHRIHYDLPYATEVEKYPGLVVHGPLQATLLMQEAMQHAGRAPASFSFRGIHPVLHTDDLHLYGMTTPEGMNLCTGMPGAHQGMQAKISWRD